MANPTGESNGEVLRLDFDRRLSAVLWRATVAAMRRRLIRLSVMIAALGMAACAGRTPAVLNAFSGPGKPDSEVALIRSTSADLIMIDGKPIPTHPDPEKFYYRDVRLLPGQHAVTAHRIWGASFLVEPSMRIEDSRGFTFNVDAGHTYEFQADRTHGLGYRLYFWVEDTTAGRIVAGEKP